MRFPRYLLANLLVWHVITVKPFRDRRHLLTDCVDPDQFDDVSGEGNCDKSINCSKYGEFLNSLRCKYVGIPAAMLSFEIDNKWEQRIREFNKCTGAILSISYSQDEESMPEEVRRDVGEPGAEGAGVFDAYVLELPWGIDIADKLEDLEPYITESLDTIKWTDINPSARESVTFNGSVRALPLDTDYVAFGYRIDVLEKHNLSAPYTLEEMVELSETLYGKDHNDDGIPDFGVCMTAQATYFFAFMAPVFQRSKQTGTCDGDEPSCERLNPFFNTTDFEPMLRQNEAFRYVWELYERIVRTSNCPVQLYNGMPCDRRSAFRTGRCAAVISLPGTLTRMLLPVDAGGVDSPRRYNNTPSGALYVEQTSNNEIVWTPKTKSGEYWGRRTMFPGSTRVWDENSQKLVECTKELCPYALYRNGNLVNFVPYFAEVGEVYSIRETSPKLRKELIWDFIQWMSTLPSTKQPFFPVHRISQIGSYELNEFRASSGWPSTVINDLNGVLNFVYFHENSAQDLLIPGYHSYMSSFRNLHIQFLFPPPDSRWIPIDIKKNEDISLDYLCRNISLNYSLGVDFHLKSYEVDEARCTDFEELIVDLWNRITNSHGGPLIQLGKWRQALDMPYLTDEAYCSTTIRLSRNMSSITDDCLLISAELCQPGDYNYSLNDCGWDGRTITYYTDKDFCAMFRPPEPKVDNTLPCPWIPIGSADGINLLIISLACLTINLLVAILMYQHRQNPIIKATQVKIMLGFVLGACCCSLSILSFLGSNTDFNCNFRNYMIFIPITVCFAFLFAKVYRVYKIFDSARKLKPVQKLTDTEMLIYIACIIIGQIVIQLLVQFIDKPRAIEMVSTHPMNSDYCSIDHGCYPPTELVCVPERDMIIYAAIGYLVLIVLLGCVLSYQARKLPHAFCEAKYVMMAMYNILLVFTMGGVAVLIFGDARNTGAMYITLGFCLACAPTSAVVLIIGPKLWQMRNISINEAEAKIRTQLSRKNGTFTKFSSFDQRAFHGLHSVSSIFVENPEADGVFPNLNYIGDTRNVGNDVHEMYNRHALQSRIMKLEKELEQLRKVYEERLLQDRSSENNKSSPNSKAKAYNDDKTKMEDETTLNLT